MKRREFLRRSARSAAVLTGLSAMPQLAGCGKSKKAGSDKSRRPNILFAISDDQSWIYAGAYGSKIAKTPNFDRVARKGVLFNNAFCVAPQCSPNRACILTGRNIWQLEEAGVHAANFPKKFQVYTDLLEESGYFVGFTGKPWGPGNWEITGWPRNPAGIEYNDQKMDSMPARGMRNTDYAGNFEQFINDRSDDQPFCFWFGASEPHRVYEDGAGLKAGKRLEDAHVPKFFPDVETVRSDILDFAFEIEWFDKHLGRMLKIIEDAGELDNTLVVVTSDNGMPFPRAKANLYEYGIHMPLAVQWPARVSGGRVVDDLISFIDYAPTFMEAAGLKPIPAMTGKSFLNVLKSKEQGVVDKTRAWALSGRERHTHARPDNLTYPCRSIRTQQYLYIWNVKPERWPAGDPRGSGEPEGLHDVDASPTKSYLIDHRHDPDIKPFYDLAFKKRPEEELFDINKDPDCVNNLAGKPEFLAVKEDLKATLKQNLARQGDPRMHGFGDIFESYPRYSRMRNFPGFKKRGEYNPKYQVK
ncbi:hypothetical protein BVY01_01840 [bacterium I07]|nr:hypothetical protein BVY01_01840 [bacterium I07]